MRRRSSRGASLIEAAITVGVLAILALGTIEFGYAWRQSTVVEKTVQQSGRVVASVADQPMADYEALQTFRSFLGSSKNMSLDLLVVYRSTTADGAVPDQCLTTSVPGLCNRYEAADLNLPTSSFGSCTGTSRDRYWCPAGRERGRSPRPDYVGIYAQLQYSGITRSIPGGLTLERTAVYAIEPCASGLPGC